MSTKKILVIDDDKCMREATVTALGIYDYLNILEAEDGQEGIEMIKAHHPDLVITDLTMPRVRGEEVIRWIVRVYKPAFPQIRTIALSGDVREIIEPVVKAAGGDVFLAKPFTVQQLLGAVEALLASA